MFDVARCLYANGKLERIVTGYPKIRLKNENLPATKIEAHSFFQISASALVKGQLGNGKLLQKIHEKNAQHLDRATAKIIGDSNLIAMSSLGVKTGRLVKQRGNIFIINRSSHHIVSQRKILEEQSAIWGWPETLPTQESIDRELEEYQLADKIVVPSNSSFKSFENQSVEMSKIFVNPFPLPSWQIGYNKVPKKNLLYVGNVTLQKGFPTLIKAFNLLKLSDVLLHVVGVYSKPFIEFLKKQGLFFDNVIMHGPLHSKRLVTMYEVSDVFILPSVHDGWGLVVNEAMSHGCIPIVSKSAGASDQIIHGVNGFVFEAGDVTALSENILKGLGNEELRNRMSSLLSSSDFFKRTWDNFCGVYTH